MTPRPATRHSLPSPRGRSGASREMESLSLSRDPSPSLSRSVGSFRISDASSDETSDALGLAATTRLLARAAFSRGLASREDDDAPRRAPRSSRRRRSRVSSSDQSSSSEEARAFPRGSRPRFSRRAGSRRRAPRSEAARSPRSSRSRVRLIAGSRPTRSLVVASFGRAVASRAVRGHVKHPICTSQVIFFSREGVHGVETRDAQKQLRDGRLMMTRKKFLAGFWTSLLEKPRCSVRSRRRRRFSYALFRVFSMAEQSRENQKNGRL